MLDVESASSLSPAPTKEDIIDADRTEHCLHFLTSRVAFHEIPPTKNLFKTAFSNSALIQGRGEFLLPARAIPARHALIYDSASDQLATPTTGLTDLAHASRAAPPDLQLFKMAADAFREVCTSETDSVLIPSSQSKQGVKDLQKALGGKYNQVHDVNIVYAQTGQRTHSSS